MIGMCVRQVSQRSTILSMPHRECYTSGNTLTCHYHREACHGKLNVCDPQIYFDSICAPKFDPGRGTSNFDVPGANSMRRSDGFLLHNSHSRPSRWH